MSDKDVMSSCNDFLSEVRRILGDEGSIQFSLDENLQIFRFQVIYKGRVDYFDVTSVFISDVPATLAAERFFGSMLAKHGGMRR